MIQFKVKVHMDDLLRKFGVLEKDAPFAVARALTWTAQDVREAEQRHIAEVINNPTTYTLRSLFLERATKSKLKARVWLKGDPYSQHYMLPLIEGGERKMKRFERRLQMTGYMRADERAVPGQGIALDAYGNISRGLINKILSQLRTAVVSGDYSNASSSKRSRAKRAGVQYFASQGPQGGRSALAGRAKGGGVARAAGGQHLPRGVWERRQHAWGSSVRPVMLFVPTHRYSKLLKFFEVADQVVGARLVHHAEVSMGQLMKDTGFSNVKVGGR